MNKVIISGRLTKDPELRSTQNGTNVAKYTIAINTGYGEKQQTDFVNISTWGKSGEFVNKYFKKGQEISIVGRLKSNTYEDKSGNKRYTLDVISEDIEFIGRKKQDDPSEEIPQNYKTDYQDKNIHINDDDLPF